MTKPYKGSPREARAIRVFLKLTRATESAAAKVQRGLVELDLTPGQLGVLEALLEFGPLSQRELGRKLFRSDPNMTTVVDNLEKGRLVRRDRSTEDRRIVLVSMTPNGRRRLERAFPSYARSIAEFMAVLTEREQDELGRLCERLGVGVAPSSR